MRYFWARTSFWLVNICECMQRWPCGNGKIQPSVDPLSRHFSASSVPFSLQLAFKCGSCATSVGGKRYVQLLHTTSRYLELNVFVVFFFIYSHFRLVCTVIAKIFVRDLISYISYFWRKVRNLVAYENHTRIQVNLTPPSLYENL